MVGFDGEADYIKINFYNRSFGDWLRPGEASVRQFPLDDKPLMGDPGFLVALPVSREEQLSTAYVDLTQRRQERQDAEGK